MRGAQAAVYTHPADAKGEIMNRFAKLAIITGAGLIAHQTDRPLLAIEYDTTSVAGKQPSGLWYMFVRYGIGVLVVLLGQEWLNQDDRERSFENGLLSSMCVGVGVFTGHLFDDLWRG